MECIENLIGITASECPCVTDGLTAEQQADLKTSVSGLYLDGNLEGGVSMSDIKEFQYCGEFYRLARKAIDSAKIKFRDDLTIVLNERYTKRKAKFNGTLGRMTFGATLSVTKEFQLLKIAPVMLQDALMTINGIRLALNESGQVPVMLIKAYEGATQGEIIKTWNANVTAGVMSAITLDAPLMLPLAENGEKVIYYFAWQRVTPTIAPRDNKLSCGCSGGDAYDNYVTLQGGETNSLNALNTSDAYAHGFMIDAVIGCELGKIVCKDFDAENPVAITSAWANLYKAGELLIEYILQSKEINRLTMMNREYLWGKRNHFRKEYETRILYLRDAIDLTNNSCFICRENKMFVGNIYG